MVWIKRLISTIIAPFLRYIRVIKTKFSITRILTKLNQKIIKGITAILNFRPNKWDDYFKIQDWLIAKKIVLLIALICCIMPLIYFSKIAKPIPTSAQTQQDCKEKEFVYDDMALKDYSGKAIIKNKAGNVIYEGDIAEGLCTGAGTLYDMQGNKVYEGDFVENEYMGAGKLYNKQGRIIYEGEFAKNLYQGYGILKNTITGECYEGNFVNGKKEGAGTLYDKSGNIIFQGEYTNDHFNGESKRFTNENLIYEGAYKSGLKDGEGKLYNNKGVLIYEGGFSSGKKHGQGKEYAPDTGRLIYEGEYLDDKKQGMGKIYNTLGKEIFEGPLYAGEVDYTTYLEASWATAEKQFKEAPEIIYMGESTFLYYKDLKVIFKLDLNLTELEKNAQDVLTEDTIETAGEQTTEKKNQSNIQPQTLMENIISQLDTSQIEIKKIIVLGQLNKAIVLDEENKVSKKKESIVDEKDELSVIDYLTKPKEDKTGDISKGNHIIQLIPPTRITAVQYATYQVGNLTYEVVFEDSKNSNIAYYKIDERGE